MLEFIYITNIIAWVVYAAPCINDNDYYKFT